MIILVVNVGSTSLKFKLFDMAWSRSGEHILAHGSIESIGQERSRFRFSSRSTESVTGAKPFRDFLPAIQEMIAFLGDARTGALGAIDQLDAVAFKTVLAGYVPDAVELTEDILRRMEEFSIVAPIHNPAYIRAIRTFRELLPEKPLIGLFEPSFHVTMPEYAYLYAVPIEWVERYGIRRYGYHGASHRYIAERVPELLRHAAEGLKIISCHLGGSSSITAIKDGKSIDTSMGFSPQSGVPQGTRPNDLDPFAALYLMKKMGLGYDEMAALLCKECGLLGLSGVSAEFKDIENAIGAGDKRAELAVKVFTYSIKKYIGAYVVALEGLDVLVFTGGIGERSARVREGVCSGLGFLGVELDREKNRSASGESDVSAAESRVRILVVPTNEEMIVARAAAALLEQRHAEFGEK